MELTNHHGLVPAKRTVPALRTTLYRAAKADPKRRFHSLYDKVYRRDVVEQAWEQVRRNRGSAGIDRMTLDAVEQYGVTRLLDEVVDELRERRYRVLPARRVWIPKPGSTEKRPLSIPTVRDRIVQTAMKLVMEPVFEADFGPMSYGFRPGKSQHDALQVLLDESWRGRRWVVESDIANCFESIPHDRLMQAVEERIVDGPLLTLIRAFLGAGVQENGVVRRATSGTPQGGVISPLLCNVYLNRLDRVWETRGCGVLVRYADDLVVMCKNEAEAKRALVAMTAILAELGLEPKAAKTRIVHLEEGGEGFDFLGFHHRQVRGRSRKGQGRSFTFLARWPSCRAMQRARDRLRELTDRSLLGLPLKEVVQGVNRFLEGWAEYFRYGNSSKALVKTMAFAAERIARFVAKLHRKRFSFGWLTYCRSPDRLGLVSLKRMVVTPRPTQLERT